MPRQKHSIQIEKHTTVKTFDSIFADRLSDLIKSRINIDGKTDKERKGKLASDLHVTVRVIELWMAKQSRPDIERLATIADYFGVTVDHLVGRVKSPAPKISEAKISDKYGLSVESLKLLEVKQDMSRDSQDYAKMIETLNLIIKHDILYELSKMIFAPFEKKNLDELYPCETENGRILYDIVERYTIELFELYNNQFTALIRDLRERKIRALLEKGGIESGK